MNPYLELGITPTATLEELKQAYRRAVLQYHPDSAIGKGDPEKFNAVLQAYQVLKNKHEKNVSVFPEKENVGGRQGLGVDAVTAQMSIEQLAHYLENTDNPHVRIVAINALILKKNSAAIRYLLNLMSRTDPATQCHIIRMIGESRVHQASPALFPLIFSKDPQVVFEAVRSLEVISPTNRTQIVHDLKENDAKFWTAVLSPFRRLYQGFTAGRKQMETLGKILLNNQRISSEQLQIALLLQKKHQMLLGAILTKLGYVSSAEIQRALLIQKR